MKLTSLHMLRKIIPSISGGQSDQAETLRNISINLFEATLGVLKVLSSSGERAATSDSVKLKVECLHTLTVLITNRPTAELSQFWKETKDIVSQFLDDSKRVVRKFARACVNELMML